MASLLNPKSETQRDNERVKIDMNEMEKNDRNMFIAGRTDQLS